MEWHVAKGQSPPEHELLSELGSEMSGWSRTHITPTPTAGLMQLQLWPKQTTPDSPSHPLLLLCNYLPPTLALPAAGPRGQLLSHPPPDWKCPPKVSRSLPSPRLPVSDDRERDTCIIITASVPTPQQPAPHGEGEKGRPQPPVLRCSRPSRNAGHWVAAEPQRWGACQRVPCASVCKGSVRRPWRVHCPVIWTLPPRFPGPCPHSHPLPLRLFLPHLCAASAGSAPDMLRSPRHLSLTFFCVCPFPGPSLSFCLKNPI